MVHKSTHHFDLVNWWLEDEVEEVMAFGNRRFYGPTRSECGERCLTCGYSKTCEFYYDIKAHSDVKELYLDCESADGYFRDRCIFSPDINIEDDMSVNAKYSQGALMSYSLIAHSPYEGWRFSISGTNGRLEAAEYHSGLKAVDSAYYFDVYDRNGRKSEWTVPKSGGSHGGGDERLQDMIFVGNIPDPLGLQAGPTPALSPYWSV